MMRSPNFLWPAKRSCARELPNGYMAFSTWPTLHSVMRIWQPISPFKNRMRVRRLTDPYLRALMNSACGMPKKWGHGRGIVAGAGFISPTRVDIFHAPLHKRALIGGVPRLSLSHTSVGTRSLGRCSLHHNT